MIRIKGPRKGWLEQLKGSLRSEPNAQMGG